MRLRNSLAAFCAVLLAAASPGPFAWEAAAQTVVGQVQVPLGGGSAGVAGVGAGAGLGVSQGPTLGPSLGLGPSLPSVTPLTAAVRPTVSGVQADPKDFPSAPGVRSVLSGRMSPVTAGVGAKGKVIGVLPSQDQEEAPAAGETARERLEGIAAKGKEGAGNGEQKVEGDERWDNASRGKTEVDLSGGGRELPQSNSDSSLGSGLKQAAKKSVVEESELERLTTLGAVPAPRVVRAKAAMLGYWSTLIGAGVALHAPFDRIGPLVIALILSPAISLFAAMIMGSMTQARGASESISTATAEELPSGLEEKVRVLAASAGVAAPAAIKILADETQIQAYVQGGGSDYTLGMSKALLAQRPEVVEGVLRHEFAHVRHRDNLLKMAQLWLAPVGPMLVMLSGLPDGHPVLMTLAVVAAVLGFTAFMKHDEYQADQASAAAMGGPAGLARFFIRDSDDERRAASALSGRAFADLSGWRRAWALAWAWLLRVFSSHPAHDFRLARLARLAARSKAPAGAQRPRGERAGP